MSHPKSEDDYTVTLSPNGHADPTTLWGTFVEVPASQLPTTFHLPRAVWDALYAEVSLRLERTPASKALALPFKNFNLVQRAHVALRLRANRDRGQQAISFRQQKEPPVLYMRRGPNWSK